MFSCGLAATSLGFAAAARSTDRFGRRHLLPVVLLIVFPTPLRAQSDDTLLDLVVSQAAMIKSLQERVAVLEEHEKEKGPVARVAPVSDAPQPVIAAKREVLASNTARPAAPSIAVDWSEGGPNFSLPDGTNFHLRGRLYIDSSTTSGSRFASRNISGTELSSARLGADGRYGKHWVYKTELEFADGAVSLKENYLGFVTKLGGNDLKIYAGNKTGDRSIDGASYDGYVPFFQRTMLATSVGPEKGIFGVGVLAQIIGSN